MKLIDTHNPHLDGTAKIQSIQDFVTRTIKNKTSVNAFIRAHGITDKVEIECLRLQSQISEQTSMMAHIVNHLCEKTPLDDAREFLGKDYPIPITKRHSTCR